LVIIEPNLLSEKRRVSALPWGLQNKKANPSAILGGKELYDYGMS
jgi:hypothetical protein